MRSLCWGDGSRPVRLLRGMGRCGCANGSNGFPLAGRRPGLLLMCLCFMCMAGLRRMMANGLMVGGAGLLRGYKAEQFTWGAEASRHGGEITRWVMVLSRRGVWKCPSVLQQGGGLGGGGDSAIGGEDFDTAGVGGTGFGMAALGQVATDQTLVGAFASGVGQCV